MVSGGAGNVCNVNADFLFCSKKTYCLENAYGFVLKSIRVLHHVCQVYMGLPEKLVPPNFMIKNYVTYQNDHLGIPHLQAQS